MQAIGLDAVESAVAQALAWRSGQAPMAATPAPRSGLRLHNA
jgi:hypothetical protein